MNPFEDNSSRSTPAPTPLDDSMTPSWLKETPVPLENDTRSGGQDFTDVDVRPKKQGLFQFRGSGIGFVIFALLIAGAVITALAVFAFTCFQFKNTTSTTGGYALITAGGGNPCDVVLDKPMRFKFVNDPSGQYLTCSWNTKNQLARLGFSIIAVLAVIIPIIGFKKYKRWVVIIFGLLSFLIALAYAYSFVIDVNDVRISNAWCNDGLSGITNTSDSSTECSYWPFILMGILDLVAVVLWAVAGIITIRYVRRYMKPSFEQL